MKCRICESLEREYQQLQRKYEGALSALAKASEQTPSKEYAALNRIVSDTALDLQASRLSLVEHRHTHSANNLPGSFARTLRTAEC